ncbi:MAG: flavin reductase [Rectinema sp.]|jgi:flavin reductase (DIM6/NTAB) family NADH-FMN oxidoreductase RutF
MATSSIPEKYKEIPAGKAYSLQNPGGLILLCTRGSTPKSSALRYDFAPLAWCTPYEYDPVSKLLLVCDTSHKTFRDIQENGQFVVALPSFEMRALIERAGAVSGFDVDKFELLEVPYFTAQSIDIRIPEGVAAWMECSLERIIVEGTSGIVLGAIHKAFGVPESWKLRLHYLDDTTWYTPGKRL